jgi:hypothetical protein
VLFRIVGITDVVVVDFTTTVFIENCVGFLDESDTLGIHRAFNDSQEFIVIDSSIAILIESSEQGLDIDIGELEARLLAAFGKLMDIKGTRTVVVHNLEDTADTND